MFPLLVDVARRQRRRGSGPAAAAAAGNVTAKRRQGYSEFFMQTVPVAPNRFSPVNHVGDMVRLLPCCWAVVMVDYLCMLPKDPATMVLVVSHWGAGSLAGSACCCGSHLEHAAVGTLLMH